MHAGVVHRAPPAARSWRRHPSPRARSCRSRCSGTGCRPASSGPRFGGVRVAVEQRLGRHQEARRAEAALQRRLLEELLLQRVHHAVRPCLRSSRQCAGPRPRGQHQAGADQTPVDDHRAGAAVAGSAPFLAAGQLQFVAQRIEQALPRAARNSTGSPLTTASKPYLAHASTPARVHGRWRARGPASTPPPWCDRRSVPRLSSIGPAGGAHGGLHAVDGGRVELGADQRRARRLDQQCTTGATAPSATRAALHVPAHRASG
jgi:hypothetical protein